MQKVVSSTVNVHFRLLNKGCRFSSFPAETRTQIECLNDFFVTLRCKNRLCRMWKK